MNKQDELSITFAKLLWALRDFRDAQHRQSLDTVENLAIVLEKASKDYPEVEW